MGDEFYAAIKLVSGEEIVSLVSMDENEGDPVLVLQTPIIMKMTNTPRGGFIKIKPWMEIPDDDFYIIRREKIITMTEIKNEMIIELYNNYLEDSEGNYHVEQGKVKPSKKMGYISSVEDARKFLENIFNNIKES